MRKVSSLGRPQNFPAGEDGMELIHLENHEGDEICEPCIRTLSSVQVHRVGYFTLCSVILFLVHFILEQFVPLFKSHSPSWTKEGIKT